MIWYEDEVKYLESKRPHELVNPGTVVFYGSSSIRLWETLHTDFTHVPIVNLGFGGSTLASCTWYFERLVLPYQPKSLVLYAGDNDLGDGRHPEEVFLFFQVFHHKVQKYLGQTSFSFVSIKPSPSKAGMLDQIRYTNELIRRELADCPNHHYIDIFTPMLDANGYTRPELFVEDGLHMNAHGYEIWKRVLSEHGAQLF